MANNLVRIDTSSLAALVDKLGQLNGEGLERVVLTSLNAVAPEAYNLGRHRMNAGINLTDGYLLSHMTIRPAERGHPKATITAQGDITGLSHFNPVQLIQAAAKAKGSPARGIPGGAKSAGVNVTVSRGSPKPLKSSKVFIAPNLKDSEGNPFVMRRLPGRTKSGKGRMERLLGPAVYQLFAHQLPTLAPEAEEALTNELLHNVEQEFLKDFQ